MLAHNKSNRTVEVVEEECGGRRQCSLFAGKVQLSDITHSNTEMTFLTATLEIH